MLLFNFSKILGRSSIKKLQFLSSIILIFSSNVFAKKILNLKFFDFRFLSHHFVAAFCKLIFLPKIGNLVLWLII